VGVHVGADDFAAALRGLAAGLRFFKVVRLDEEGGLETVEEGRHSFVDLEELKGWLAEGGSSLAGADRMALWKEVAALLGAGLPAVNVCTAAGLTEELFTYSGVGTLFTRERYVGVRALTIDDYAAAADLVARGMEEGYLAPRSEAEIDRILVSGFGAFVEDHHLAGMGALLHWDDQGEISALYTLTRFLGEGVGQHLVAHAVERAASLGLRGIFACTTSERVASFFERQGFSQVPLDKLPAAKWKSYVPASSVPEVDCKPGSVPARRPARIIHLGGALLRRSSTLTRTPGPCGPWAGRPQRCPYSSLLQEGLAPPPVTRLSRVGSYPTFSPLPVPPPAIPLRTAGIKGHRRCRFCGAFPRVTPGRR